MPRVEGSLRVVECPLSILARIREESLAEQVSRMGPSAFISLSTATSYMSEFWLTDRDLSSLPLTMFITFRLPSRAAQKTSSGLSTDGCSWQMRSEAYMTFSLRTSSMTYINGCLLRFYA